MLPLDFMLESFSTYGFDEEFFLKPFHIHQLIEQLDQGVDYNILDRYFLSNSLKKHPDLLGVDVSEVTIDDFNDMEKLASDLDERFVQLLMDERVLGVLRIWQKEVRLIMGPAIIGPGVITSGATSTVSSGNTPLERFKNTELTSGLASFYQAHPEIDDLPWESFKLGYAEVNIVPKTAYIGRVVFSPCAGNAFEQKRHGKTFSNRLARFGIDIPRAQDVHQRMAFHGSIKKHLTTDDQKWASGLIYTALVRYLVSPEWFSLLSASRDSYARFPDGSLRPLSQFATMGNGYCFELETIIFFGMLRTAAVLGKYPKNSKDIKVFGDDLIYPSELTKYVRGIGRMVGFITNVDKSYSEGSFRESCGADYYDGLNIRPVYIKKSFDHPYDLTISANIVKTLLDRYEWNLPLMKRLWIKLIQRIYKIGSKSKALWGPNHMSCLHGRPMVNWRTVSLPSPDYGITIKTWEVSHTRKYSFREIAYDASPQLVLNIVVAGWMKGYGAVYRPQQVLRHWIFGPPRPAYSLFPKNIPIPGSPITAKVVDRRLYLSTNIVDALNPLDVFTHLALTNCPNRIYAKDYIFAKNAELLSLRQELLKQLTRVREIKMASILEPVSLVDLSFLD